MNKCTARAESRLEIDCSGGYDLDDLVLEKRIFNLPHSGTQQEKIITSCEQAGSQSLASLIAKHALAGICMNCANASERDSGVTTKVALATRTTEIGIRYCPEIPIQSSIDAIRMCLSISD